jgi:hypothetical protein
MYLLPRGVLSDSLREPHWSASIVDPALGISDKLAAGVLQGHEPKERRERGARP